MTKNQTVAKLPETECRGKAARQAFYSKMLQVDPSAWTDDLNSDIADARTLLKFGELCIGKANTDEQR